MARIFITLGVLFLAIGLLWLVGERLGLGLGRLPGDIVIERGGVRISIPLMTCLVISALLSLAFWLIGR